MKNPLRKTVIKIRQLREAMSMVKSTNFRFLRFSPPGHFYSPIPDYESLKNRKPLFNQDVREIPGLELREKKQLELVDRLAGFYRELPWKEDAKNSPLRYHFDNIYFSYGDAVTLYSMMRHFQPKRMIEAGSGFSSAAMLDVDERFFDGEIQFTFIEPHPERLRELLSDEDLDRVSILSQPVQQVDLSEFELLDEGDFLFVDSSHVSKTGSDVNFLIHSVLPALKSGVIIHFHDIFWPFEYPKKWLKSGRAWNECYLIRAFLLYNPQFEILFFNSYLEKHHRKKIREKLPLMLRQPSAKMTFGNSSLWLRKK
ncbi:class I SAM-dependent methyltransferase [Rhodohalobacter sp. SW132]|uniref:class I SAM-dependent methyltransferase n=1 Tax=Rhodohalobacter sp. SW132 TaxID=2293433 RepID=UPI000E264F6C|nr:class I SAM-dependent methyltransferase [Rhodohalobacter sp. SW132]REL32855.1 class I SAM-dependent methyltransferase [Rhodohalobacter sp. SW132]